jgi:leader peptidase (prepilin peptidase) / N-methyltransferase
VILFDTTPMIVWTFLFLIGACVGSFLNRLPQHESVWQAWASLGAPPSSCPFCRRRILAIDNVPILGWLWLWGRCRFCRHRISARYPLIELLNGLLWVGPYLVLVPTGYTAPLTDSSLVTPLGPLQPPMPHLQLVFWLHVQYAYFLVLVEALVVASFIDFDLQIIPDSVTLPAMAVGLAGSLTGMVYLTPVWFQDPNILTALWEVLIAPGERAPDWMQTAVPAWCTAWPMRHGLAVSVAGLLVGGGIVWFVRIAGQWVFRREAMGFGDVILMAMIGSFLGWQATVIVFFLAPMCALVTVAATWLFSRQREIPFGPYLSLGALLALFGWQPLFQATEQCFGLGPFLPVLAIVMGAFLIVVLWLVQGLKWLLGIPLYEPEWSGEWTSADQLAFFASRDPDAGRGGLAPPQWPGSAAGRGQIHQRHWQGDR